MEFQAKTRLQAATDDKGAAKFLKDVFKKYNIKTDVNVMDFDDAGGVISVDCLFKGSGLELEFQINPKGKVTFDTSMLPAFIEDIMGKLMKEPQIKNGAAMNGVVLLLESSAKELGNFLTRLGKALTEIEKTASKEGGSVKRAY